MKHPEIVVGAKFEHPYPFYREDVELGDGYQESWRPGVAFTSDRGTGIADGLGAQLLEVISTHKPGKYPQRVFYVRQWRDPDGKVFGKRALRVAGIGAFRALIKGYRNRYEVRDAAARRAG